MAHKRDFVPQRAAQRRHASSPAEVPGTQRWLTVKEAAAYARCSVQTILSLIHTQKIPATQVSEWGFLVDRLDMDNYLERRKKIVAP